ncbi:MAG TPA: tRNA-binding protein [Nitrososphaerales archaeon]|nr:tRNA-binding protein [Nitrososphaerales archaeon]
MSVSIDEFSKIEMKVGKVASVDDIPQARKPMYRLAIDFGDGTTKQCVAGIKQFYTKEQLLGKRVVAVVNLQPKSVAGVVSECMMLAAFNEEVVSLLSPDRDLPLGTKVG